MILQNNIIRKIKQINIKVPKGSSSTEFYFEDQPDLRNASLIALAILPHDAAPLTYENNFAVNQSALDVSYITLKDMSGFSFTDQTHVTYFNPLNNSNTNLWGVLFNGQKLNWSKCFIHIADVSLISATDDEYYQIIVTYEYLKK